MDDMLCFFMTRYSLDKVLGKMGNLYFFWRHSGLMVSALVSQTKRFGFDPWPGTLCCVLVQDT